MPRSEGGPFLSFAQAFFGAIVKKKKKKKTALIRINCQNGVPLKHSFVYCRLRNYGRGSSYAQLSPLYFLSTLYVTHMINYSRPSTAFPYYISGGIMVNNTSNSDLPHLKCYVLTILKRDHLLPPIQKMCVVDHLGTKLRMVQDTWVVQPQVIHFGTDKPVTQIGLASPLTRQTRIAGGCQSTNCHTKGQRSSLTCHGQSTA